MNSRRISAVCFLVPLALLATAPFAAAQVPWKNTKNVPFKATHLHAKKTPLHELLKKMEGSIQDKTIWFYRFLGKSFKKDKVAGLTKEDYCDYDDPSKIKFCPPVVPPPHVVKAPPTTAATTSTSSAGSGTKTTTPTPFSPEFISKCLDNPDDPECIRLLQDGPGNSGSHTSQGGANSQSTNYVTTMPTGTNENLATQEPTRDDCYGNMLDGRFCTSEMPSVSEEPSLIPKPTRFIPPGETGFYNLSDAGSGPYGNGAGLNPDDQCMIDMHNVYDSPYPLEDPIHVLSANNLTVTFTVLQTWFKMPDNMTSADEDMKYTARNGVHGPTRWRRTYL